MYQFVVVASPVSQTRAGETDGGGIRSPEKQGVEGGCRGSDYRRTDVNDDHDKNEGHDGIGANMQTELFDNADQTTKLERLIEKFGPLPALSIKQPWAWLIVNGLKDIENRIGVSYFKDLIGKDDYNRLCIEWDRLPTGGIVGVSEIVDCVSRYSSKWFVGDWGDVRVFYRIGEWAPRNLDAKGIRNSLHILTRQMTKAELEDEAGSKRLRFFIYRDWEHFMEDEKRMGVAENSLAEIREFAKKNPLPGKSREAIE